MEDWDVLIVIHNTILIQGGTTLDYYFCIQFGGSKEEKSITVFQELTAERFAQILMFEKSLWVFQPQEKVVLKVENANQLSLVYLVFLLGVERKSTQCV